LIAGDVVQAVKHARTIQQEIRVAQVMSDAELYGYAKKLGVDVELLRRTRELGRLPVVNFAAGGLGRYTHCSVMLLCVPLATPADVGMLMQLGVDGVFVGSGIFKSSDPKKRAAAMVQAVTHYNDPAVLARVSEDLGDAMVCGIYSSIIIITFDNRLVLIVMTLLNNGLLGKVITRINLQTNLYIYKFLQSYIIDNNYL